MERIPITLITGFLGAGKTTLLNKIIESNKDLQLGIVLNEFGDVALESQFLISSEDEVVELGAGCVCCVARGDLIEALDKVLKANPKTNYIVLEASGLSDPIALSLTFYNPSVSSRFALDSVICVVDAINFEKTLDEHDIARQQVNSANIIMLSKAKDVDTNKINQLKELVSSLNEKAIIGNVDEQLDMNILLDRSLNKYQDIEQYEEEEHNHDEHSHEDVSEVFFKSQDPLDYYLFEELLRNLPKEIIRAKGFINFANAPIKNDKGEVQKYLLQYVVGRKDYLPKDWDSQKNTALLFLGKEFNKVELLQRLEACKYKEKGSSIMAKLTHWVNS